jgi:hypothetical protein
MATGNVVITCTLTKTLNAATSTNLLRRFQIDDELELLRLLDGQIYGLGPFENFIHVDSGAPVQVAQTHAVPSGPQARPRARGGDRVFPLHIATQ